MQTQSRVVGSGFTRLAYRGQSIAWLDSFEDKGQEPVAPVQAVHPLGDRYVREFASARALGSGSITFSIRELWSAPVWWQLGGLSGTYNILDVYERLAAEASSVTVQMLIVPPGGVAPVRGKTYHNCFIDSIPTEENVSLGALTFAKTVSMLYTHTTPITQTA
jgi:hypothetical protein